MSISKRRGRRLPGQVKELRQEIERWRRTRAKQSAMPAELWNGAVGMAGEYGASVIARSLGIDYKSLRSRAAKAAGKTTAGGAGFIEMRPAEAVPEMCDAGGPTLVLRCVGGVEIDVMRLVEVFRNGSAHPDAKRVEG